MYCAPAGMAGTAAGSLCSAVVFMDAALEGMLSKLLAQNPGRYNRQAVRPHAPQYMGFCRLFRGEKILVLDPSPVKLFPVMLPGQRPGRFRLMQESPLTSETDASTDPNETINTAPSSLEYGWRQIDKLEGLAGVRQRPGMYIGPTDERGLHHCVFEVLDNSIDEHLAGFCTKIDVAFHAGGSCSIRDNGRGIPVEMHEKFGIPALRIGADQFARGRQIWPGAYKYSGGLHGVGAKCVNALSDWFKVEVLRDGKIFHMAFERGVTTQPLTVLGEQRGAARRARSLLFCRIRRSSRSRRSSILSGCPAGCASWLSESGTGNHPVR